MSRVIVIAGHFDVIERGRPTGRKEFVASHGIDESTGRNVVLPSEHPSSLGAKWDDQLQHWVIPADPQPKHSNTIRSRPR